MAFVEYTVRLPSGLTFQDLVGAGITGIVVRLDAVVKHVHPENKMMLDREIQVYERLQKDHKDHPRFLRYYGAIENGLILGHAHNSTVRQYIRSHPAQISLALRLRWIEQILETVAVLHSSSILHGDLSCNNFFLDENLDIKGGDFAGSQIDGQERLTSYETRCAHPNLSQLTLESEIFALGSCFYEIIAWSKPYAELTDIEIEKAYLREEFPDTAPLDACNYIITKRWTRYYKRIADIAQDFRAEIEHLALHDQLLSPKHVIPKPSRYLHLATSSWYKLPMVCSLAILPALVWTKWRR